MQWHAIFLYLVLRPLCGAHPLHYLHLFRIFSLFIKIYFSQFANCFCIAHTICFHLFACRPSGFCANGGLSGFTSPKCTVIKRSPNCDFRFFYIDGTYCPCGNLCIFFHEKCCFYFHLEYLLSGKSSSSHLCVLSVNSEDISQVYTSYLLVILYLSILIWLHADLAPCYKGQQDQLTVQAVPLCILLI